MSPILIEEGYWMNSQLSVARFYGGIKFNGEEYVIVPPNNDMIQAKWAKIYTKLGRDKFIEIVKQGTSLADAKKMIKTIKDNSLVQLKLDF